MFARNILREDWGRVEDFKYSPYTSIPHSNELPIFLDGSTFSLGCIPYIGYLQAVLDIHLHVPLTI